MRLTDDGVVTSDYDVTAVSAAVNMSIASDTSSSGTSRTDVWWSDEKFNTRRTSESANHKHGQDSQSSESESLISDNSGSGLQSSFGLASAASQQHFANPGQELRCNSFGSSSLLYHNDSTGGSHVFNISAFDPDSRKTDLSHSYDQTMMVHVIRKQKALAHYYELQENAIHDSNIYINYKKSSLQDSSPRSSSGPLGYGSVFHETYRRVSSPDVVCRGDSGHKTSANTSVMQRRTYESTRRPITDRDSTDASPPNNLFYLPVSVPYTGSSISSSDTCRGLPHLEINRDDYYINNINGHQTRALSADFGTKKIPSFPCHRAALGEALPNELPVHALSSSWNGCPESKPSPARKSLSAMFNLISVSGQNEGCPTRNDAKHKTRGCSPEDGFTSKRRLQRSCSAPNQLDQWTDDDEKGTDDDDDDDDFGFLSHPGFVHVSAPASPNKRTKSPPTSFTGMQKANKSPATSHRILPRRWRKLKTPVAAKHVSIWKPEGGCIWSCTKGCRLTLSPVSLLTLTEVERVALQKIAQAKLQALNLGCAIPIPKDWNRDKRSKKSTFSSLRKRTASTSAVESSKCKENKDSGGVFGIPLGKCVANDMELRRRKSSNLRGEHQDLSTRAPRHRNSSRTSATTSSESLSDCGNPGSNLLDALSLSSSTPYLESRLDMEGYTLSAHVPQVPYVVTTCCKHLETYGLRVLGIFRIGSSKKRSKQLREEIDSCRDIKLNESHNPHDVAALLKEFFRDLPDPLFTRDLYSAFIATRKITDHKQRLHALTMLICLLPTPNRDTLWALLRFLNVVVQHSTDVITETGQVLPGNKMDSTNLATLFGPNLLHKAKGGEFQVESIDRAEERQDIISVIKELIDQQEIVFKLQPEIQDELYRRLLEINPEALDFILDRRARGILRSDIEQEASAGSLLDESEGLSMPRSTGYSSENDLGVCPRSFVEAIQLCSAESQPQLSVVPPAAAHQQLRVTPADGPVVYQSSPSPLTTPKAVQHRPAGRARSDNTGCEGSSSRHHLHVPANYRLSAPDTSAWHRGDRSVSPASPRISPCPKAMKAGTPELRVRMAKSESPDKSLPAQTGVSATAGSGGSSPNPQGRRSVGIPHGPGPEGHRTKAKNTLTVPVPCSRSKSTESCSSVGSSSGYQGGSSRSGTNSPMTPDSSSTGHKKWYLETPPESPKDGSPSPFQRTSSTHRPLGFNVPSGPHCPSASQCPTYRSNSSDSPSGSAPFQAEHPARLSSGSAAVQWQKERWCHWEQLTRQHSEEQHEQETLV